jgi:hypothetical protein
MSKSLRLPLKTKWFEMTKAGIKKEDYRNITPYWYSIFYLYDGKKRSRRFWEFAPLGTLDFDTSKVLLQKFDTNTMTLGYPKSTDTDKILTYEHKGIEIRTGNPEWGAEPNKLYFVIKHGNLITI